MDLLNNNTTLMLRKSMDFLWTKQSCIFDNITNAETPGYKPKYATFEVALDNAIRAAAKNNSRTDGIRNAIADTRIKVGEEPQSTRMDDNGVDVTAESFEMSRNAYQLQYVMDALSNDISVLRTAIRG